MTAFHIVNGDCLADQLKQAGIAESPIICRECLIEGDLYALSLDDFWKARSKFISENYHVPAEEYFTNTVSEFEKIICLPEDADVCLWFENDLFCQANLWFIISLLSNRTSLKVWRVFPHIENEGDVLKGFAIADAGELRMACRSRIRLTSEDLELGQNLWKAYKSGDLNKLKALSELPSHGFRYLKEVCQAHSDRFPSGKSLGRPEMAVQEIIESGSTIFETVFKEFSK